MTMTSIAWIFFLIGTVAGINYTASEKFITSAGSLQDSQLEMWASCQPNEECTQRRLHACATNKTHPELACGQNIWKEELFGCLLCDSHWMEWSSWSDCAGNGCGDTIQTLGQICANKAVNTNCKQIRTRFCQPKEICDGTWTTWSSGQDSCEKRCETQWARALERRCEKNGKPSGNCETKQPPFFQNKVQYCSSVPCPKSSTTPTTTASTTTKSSTETSSRVSTIVLTAWSQWSECNASCAETEGYEKRQRSCVYQNTVKTLPLPSCATKELVQVRRCTPQEIARCTTQPKKSPEVTTRKPTNLDTTAEAPKKRAFIFQKSGTTTTAQDETTIQAENRTENGLSKQQYQILLIVLGTTVFLAILIVLIYMSCCKRRKKRKHRRKLGEISVVALQSHTGFMEGMEKYGFKSTMMPSGPLITTLQPSSVEGSGEVKQSTVHENQNSHHVYEEMKFPATEIHRPHKNTTSPMRRSLSHREKQQGTISPDMQARRRSCFAEVPYAKPYKKAPPKPPRRSMPQLDEFTKAEIREIPRALYESETPELAFIGHIQPPPLNQITPPCDNSGTNVMETPICTDGELKITPQSQISYSRSAPTSPHHYHMGAVYPAQVPFFNCVTSPLLMPYANMPAMAPMQSPNQIIYMHPLLPVHQQLQPSNNIGSISESTPLHGTNTVKRRDGKAPSQRKQRPFSAGFLPKISITDTDKALLSPTHIATHSPIIEDYAEMRHLLESTTNLEDSNSFHQKSFKNLHGTQDTESTEDLNNTKEEANGNSIIITEDNDGYVVATT